MAVTPRLSLISIALLVAGCSESVPLQADADVSRDGSNADAVTIDAAELDDAPPDAAPSPDAAPPPDTAEADATDLADAMPDAATPDAAPPPDAADVVTLTVRLDGPGQGAIAVGTATCTSVCTYVLPRGTAVTLDASVSVGPFHGWWGGACNGSTSTTCAVVLDGDTTARAVAGEGALLWLRPLQTTGSRTINDLAAHGGRAYFTGSFGGTLTFGAQSLSAGGASAWLVAAVDGIDATPAWAHRFVGTDVGPGVVAADAAGVVAAIRWSGTLDLGDGPLDPVGATATTIGAFDANGTLAWTRTLLPTVTDAMVVPWDVAVRDDTVVIVGIFWRTVDLLGATVTSQGQNGNDAFVIALDRATGAVKWRRTFSAPGHNDAEAVTVLGGGDVVVAGQQVAPIDLGGGPVRASTGVDAWLVRLDGATGAHVWSRSVGTAGDEYANGLATAPGDTVVLATRMYRNASQPTLDLGDGVTVTATTDHGTVVSRWSAGGEPTWATFVEWLDGRRGLAAPGARLWLGAGGRIVGVDLDGAVVVNRSTGSSQYLLFGSIAPVGAALFVAGSGAVEHDLDGIASPTPVGGFLARIGTASP